MNFDIEKIIELGVGAIGVITSLVLYIVGKIKEHKANSEKSTKEDLKNAIIPLMEEAERLLKDGEEREKWVIQKLSNALHIDFYKYKKILDWAKEIISNICKTTKIEVNKNRIIEVKEEKIEEKEEDGTNGIF